MFEHGFNTGSLNPLSPVRVQNVSTKSAIECLPDFSGSILFRLGVIKKNSFGIGLFDIHQVSGYGNPFSKVSTIGILSTSQEG